MLQKKCLYRMEHTIISSTGSIVRRDIENKTSYFQVFIGLLKSEID